MAASLGTDSDHLYEAPRSDLLREISGIEPEPAGIHVRLDRHAGVRSTQRLALADVGGGVVAGLWPAELMPQARYLYSEGRAGALLSSASAFGWSVAASPHLAFFNSSAHQRLYLNPEVNVNEYARAWEGADGRWIGQHSVEEVRHSLWPWLKERGYVSAGDDPVLTEFLRILGRRPAHLRPGLRLELRLDAAAVRTLGNSRQLPSTIRRAVNGVLRAAGEPTLPVAST